jgi:hypothetical protein
MEGIWGEEANVSRLQRVLHLTREDRAARRRHRDIQRAIASVKSPSMRHELEAIAMRELDR